MFGAIADAGCVALARVPANRHDHIKRVLDNGAQGVVVPMVNSRGRGRGRRRRLPVSAARQPQRRRQRPRPELRHHAADYFAHANDEIARRPAVRAHRRRSRTPTRSSRCRASTPSSSAPTTWPRACAATDGKPPSGEATTRGDEAHPGDVQEAQASPPASTASSPTRRCSASRKAGSSSPSQRAEDDARRRRRGASRPGRQPAAGGVGEVLTSLSNNRSVAAGFSLRCCRE